MTCIVVKYSYNDEGVYERLINMMLTVEQTKIYHKHSEKFNNISIIVPCGNGTDLMDFDAELVEVCEVDDNEALRSCLSSKYIERAINKLIESIADHILIGYEYRY